MNGSLGIGYGADFDYWLIKNHELLVAKVHLRNALLEAPVSPDGK